MNRIGIDEGLRSEPSPGTDHEYKVSYNSTANEMYTYIDGSCSTIGIWCWPPG